MRLKDTLKIFFHFLQREKMFYNFNFTISVMLFIIFTVHQFMLTSPMHVSIAESMLKAHSVSLSVVLIHFAV